MNGIFFCNKCGAQNAAAAQFCSRCGAPMGPTQGPVPTVVTSPPSASPNVASLGHASPYAAPAPSYQAVAPLAGVGYGGFWIRVVAAIIDAIILRLVVAPVGMIFGGLGMAGMMSGINPTGLWIFGRGITNLFFGFRSRVYEAVM